MCYVLIYQNSAAVPILKMEAERSSEKLIPIYQTTRPHILEGSQP
jgi:hypothetical protein